jgi:hypothetical protein
MGELIPLAGIMVSGALLFPIVVGFTIKKLRASREGSPGRDQEIARLEAELQQTRDELKRLAERQQFVESLLEKRSDSTALPR